MFTGKMKIYDLATFAKIVAELVPAGICFEAEEHVDGKDKFLFMEIKLTGGY